MYIRIFFFICYNEVKCQSFTFKKRNLKSWELNFRYVMQNETSRPVSAKCNKWLLICALLTNCYIYFFSLSPVKDDRKKGADNGIFLVNMKEKTMQDDEEYEPYDNRVVEHPTTWVLFFYNYYLCDEMLCNNYILTVMIS